MSRQSFGQAQRVSCCDKAFLCRDRVWPWGRFGVVTGFFLIATETGDSMLRQGIRCRDRDRCWLGQFHVATELTLSR